jgi:hypothetical protein
MLGTQSLRGLCRTCEMYEGCTFLEGSETPVWQCEEFMSGDVSTSGKKHRHRDTARKHARDADLKSARGLGICSSCEKLEECTFPQAGMGVVFCEEYQRNGSRRS